MSGHSKWATTKHKKALIDGRRAKLFAKLIKNIEVAARLGGPDMDGNPTLYDAVQKGRKSSLPNDNIERAIKRGAGVGADAVEYMTIMYEGRGPAGTNRQQEPRSRRSAPCSNQERRHHGRPRFGFLPLQP
jgi:transcriptional/translational regulatory protein YebC/TACO1